MFSLQFSRQPIRAMGFAVLVATAVLICRPVRAELTAQAVSRGSGAADLSVESMDVEMQVTGSAPTAVSGSPKFHILPANTEAGSTAALTGNLTGPAPVPALIARPLVGLPRPGFFPADLTYQGGSTIGSASSEDIYYNCPGDNQSCWGDPEGFLSDLSVSRFIHVLDQYVGLKTKVRYPLSTTFVFENDNLTRLTTTDVENFVHVAAAISTVGSGHIFHLFLPPGVDVCPVSGECYSPDNPSTFVLCAYHSTTAGDGIPYTVEPFQDVDGCRLAPPNPNSAMIDSTNSALSHELFETISDPFLDAWIADNTSVEAGNEVADICHGPSDGNAQIIAPEYVLVKRRTYQTQLEYSNKRHGCVVSP